MKVYIVKITNKSERWTDVKVFSNHVKAIKYVNDFTDTKSDPRRITVDYEFARNWNISTQSMEVA